MSHDNLDFVKNKAISTIFELLVAKPEQEKNLLTLLVNKLGDNNRKLASKASYLLSQLLLKHPNMKLVVIKEIEHLLFRTNISDRAQYYAIIFLNQIILTRNKSGEEAANKLIEIYFVLFEKLCGKNAAKNSKKSKKNSNKQGNNGAITEIDSVNVKMMAALLTGVNRTFPFAKVEDEVFDKQINTLFTISHIGTFNISIQALMLIFQVSLSRQAISDRYYRSLYMTLFDHRLFTSSKHAMYLNLLYKSLREDNSLIRVKSFIKRILQICTFHKVPFICGSLYLVSEIIKQKPGLLVMITQPEEDDNDEEEFKDVDEDKSDNEDDSSEIENTKTEENKLSKKYDGKKRDPLYTNVDNSCLWELAQFTNHYHPTVALYGQTLLSGKFIEFPKSINYDPLQNHTLSRFLDRFVYKNPKKVSNTYKGGSIMQPKKLIGDGLVSSMKKQNVILEQDDDENLGKKKRIMMDDYAVNTQNFLKRDEKDIPVDELFFYKYFKEQNAHNKKKKSKTVDIDKEFEEDDDEINDEEQEELEEDEIFKAMQSSSGFPEMDDEDEDVEFDENDFASDDDDKEGEEELDENELEKFNELEDLKEEEEEAEVEDDVEIKIEGDEEESGEDEEETKEEISKDIMDLKEMFDLDDAQIKKSKKSSKKDKKNKKEEKPAKTETEEVIDENELGDMDDEANWEDIDMDDEEGQELMNIAFGDDDMNEIDEDEEFEGIEAEMAKKGNKKKSNRKTKKMNRLEAKAKSLGYEGEYFKMGGGSFASADDWEKLLDNNPLPSEDEDEGDNTAENVAEIMKSFSNKSNNYQKGPKKGGNNNNNNNNKRKAKSQSKKNKRIKK